MSPSAMILRGDKQHTIIDLTAEDDDLPCSSTSTIRGASTILHKAAGYPDIAPSSQSARSITPRERNEGATDGSPTTSNQSLGSGQRNGGQKNGGASSCTSTGLSIFPMLSKHDQGSEVMAFPSRAAASTSRSKIQAQVVPSWAKQLATVRLSSPV
jgi:hypothetical protein